MKKRKRLLIWSGVFALLMCIVYAVMAYALINNVEGVTNLVKDLLLEFEASDVEITTLLNEACEDLIIFAVVNGVSGAVYIGFSFLNSTVYHKLRFISIGVAVISVIIGADFLSSLLAIIAGFVKEQPLKQTTADVVPQAMQGQVVSQPIPQSSEQLRERIKLQSMAEKISIIKGLKKEGSISDEEYAKVLNEILTNGVKD